MKVKLRRCLFIKIIISTRKIIIVILLFIYYIAIDYDYGVCIILYDLFEIEELFTGTAWCCLAVNSSTTRAAFDVHTIAPIILYLNIQWFVICSG